MEIVNAKITETRLGRNGGGVLTFKIFMKFAESAHQREACMGGYALEGRDLQLNHYAYSAKGMEAIAKILDTVSVDNWEDLQGSYMRVKYNDADFTVEAIGNLMSDKWFNIREFFASGKDT